jgi:Tfp pilus assembly protein PilV
MERPLESGTSIVEICVAILIVAVTGLIIMSFTRTTFSSYRDARISEGASIVAEDKLSQLNAAALPANTGSDSISVDNQWYYRSWTIEDIGLIKKATITVTFKNAAKNKVFRLTGAVD